MIERLSSFAVFVLALLLFSPPVAWPCSVCLSGLSGSDPLTDAFNWSVLFLMATPYTVVGSVAGWLVYTHRRAAAKKNGVFKNKTPFWSLAWIHKESGR